MLLTDVNWRRSLSLGAVNGLFAWTLTTCQLKWGSRLWHMTLFISFTATLNTSFYLITISCGNIKMLLVLLYIIRFFLACADIFFKPQLHWALWPKLWFVSWIKLHLYFDTDEVWAFEGLYTVNATWGGINTYHSLSSSNDIRAKHMLVPSPCS